MAAQRLAGALVPLALLLSACPVHHIEFGPQGEAKNPAELLKRVALSESTVVGLKGDAKLNVDSPQGKGSVTLFVAVQHPAYLHIEQLDFFGRPQGVLVTDGETFGLYDSQSGQYFKGPASPPNLARFLPVVLPPRELAALLLGRVARVPAEDGEMSMDDKKGVYVLTLKNGPVTQRLEIEPPSYRVVKSTVTGVRAYDVEMGDIADYGAVTLPKRIVLDAPSAKTRVELVYKDVSVNEPPDMTLFDMEPPEDVPVVEVDAAGRTVPSAPAPHPQETK